MMRIFPAVLLTIALMTVFGLAVPELHAQGTGAAEAGTTRLQNPLPTTSVPTLIGTVIKAFLGIIGSVTLIVFVYAGVLWLTSSGNAEAIAKGKNAMIWASIGLIVVFSSYALVELVLKGIGAVK